MTAETSSSRPSRPELAIIPPVTLERWPYVCSHVIAEDANQCYCGARVAILSSPFSNSLHGCT